MSRDLSLFNIKFCMLDAVTFAGLTFFVDVQQGPPVQYFRSIKNYPVYIGGRMLESWPRLNKSKIGFNPSTTSRSYGVTWAQRGGIFEPE